MSCNKPSPKLAIDLLTITEKGKKSGADSDRACNGQCNQCPRKSKIPNKTPA